MTVDELLTAFHDRHLLFLAAIAPSLAIDPLQAVLEEEGWRGAAIRISRRSGAAASRKSQRNC